MRYIFAGFAAVCLSVIVAACGGSVGPTPIGDTAGAPAQTQSSQTYSVTTTNSFSLAAPQLGGNLANIQFQAATGGPKNATMTVSVSTTSNLPSLSKARLPASMRTIKDFTYTAQWFYDVIASADLTFPMAPAWSVTVANPIAGASYFIAYYDPTVPAWNIYGGGTPQSTAPANVVYLFTPAALASPMVIPTGSPGANFALVAITGTTPTPVPTPTPPPASLPNLIADPNFANEGAAGGTWTLNSTTGWTPCFDPEATPSPAATLAPAPTITTGTQGGTGLPYNGNTYAALTGQILGQVTEPHEPRGSQGICQTITIPTNPYLWLYVEEGGNDSGAFIGQRGTLILGGSLVPAPGSTVANPTYYVSGATGEVSLFSDATCTGKATGQTYDNCSPAGSDLPIQWVMKGPYTTVLQPYVGQQAVLYLGVWASAYSSSKSYGVYMYVDGVDLVSQP